MNEVQKIILTCLLGPEDPTAFARFQKNERSRERYANFSEEERLKHSESCRISAITHRDVRNKRSRDKRQLDPEAARKAERESYAKNPEAVKKAQRKYKETHPEKVRASVNKRQKERFASDPQFRVTIALRTRLTRALLGQGVKKSAATFDLLGCPAVWLEVHLESLFKPGMTWENYGPVWHIDHIKPCAAFDLTDLEQQKICFHWTNLQPLFALENLQKSDNYVV